MRKISKEAMEAMENERNFKKSNTEVYQGSLFLHGNKIAEYTSLFKDGNKSINITLAGWNTNTTREHLNAFDGVRVNTKH